MALTNSDIINIGQTAEQINNKVDLDLRNRCSNINYIVASYQNGNNGYVVWSNGYCKQWGKTNAIDYGEVQLITLLKEYKDEFFSIAGAGTYEQSSGSARCSWAFSITAPNQIRFRSTIAKEVYWVTSGFLNINEYKQYI